MKTLDLVQITLPEFFARNSQVNKAQLADLLGVSSGVITRMGKQGMTRIQALALDALDKRLAAHNLIELDVTEWFDKANGNSYFSAWVHFKGEDHFLPFQYGYGSYCEDVAFKVLEDKGLIPKGKRRIELAMEYNITLKTDKREVNKRDMFKGGER